VCPNDAYHLFLALTTDASDLPVQSTKTDEEVLYNLIFPHSNGEPSTSEVSGARRKRSVSNSSGRGRNPKKSMAVSSTVIEQHLQVTYGASLKNQPFLAAKRLERHRKVFSIASIQRKKDFCRTK
jgi:hypothetical protein